MKRVSGSRLGVMKDCLLYAGIGFALLGGIGAFSKHRPAFTPAVLAQESNENSRSDTDSQTIKLAYGLTIFRQNTQNQSWDNAPWNKDDDFRGLNWNDAQSHARKAAENLGQKVAVQSGDTMMGLLVDNGISEADAHDAIGAMKQVYSPKDLQIGQEITLNIADQQHSGDKKLVGITLKSSATEKVTVTRAANGSFVAKTEATPLTTRLTRSQGTIRSSLFIAARESGLPMSIANEIIKAFSYDVDFQRDIQPGDSFDIVYERMDDKQGKIAKTGKMLYASLTLSGKAMPLYYFEAPGGAGGQYYAPNGESARKSLLKTPVDGARITSGFGMRNHPILGYTKMHKGVDFGAPTGTPIYAAGDGIIEFVGQQNGYGNFVKIRHNGQYETAYGHISRFAKATKKGAKVHQGDVIAFVGATGHATGPHLHYEILVSGSQVNPQSVKVVGGGKLSGKDLKAFQAQIAQVEKKRDSLANPSLLAESPR